MTDRDVKPDKTPHGSTVLLSRLRASGWAVAVHNDYRLNGDQFTFWLFIC